MARETENGMSALLAFFAGAAAGATLGLLMAPKAGQEARERIKEFSRDALEKTRATAHTMQEKVRSMKGAQNPMEEGIETMREKAETPPPPKERAEKIVDPLQSKMT